MIRTQLSTAQDHVLDGRLISIVLAQTIRPNEALADQIARELTAVHRESGDEYPKVIRLRPKPPGRRRASSSR